MRRIRLRTLRPPLRGRRRDRGLGLTETTGRSGARKGFTLPKGRQLCSFSSDRARTITAAARRRPAKPAAPQKPAGPPMTGAGWVLAVVFLIACSGLTALFEHAGASNGAAFLEASPWSPWSSL